MVSRIAIVLFTIIFINSMYAEKNSNTNLMVINDYFQARKKFLELAKTTRAELRSYPLKAKGPNGEELNIDIAWLGSKQPEKVLLHISGTHGVEGFAGSAIQSEILSSEIFRKDLTTKPTEAIIFIHALNPYGMSHLRRVNESNVDLNRNFQLDPSKYTGAPEDYKKIASFLNPKSAPTRIDLFFPRVAGIVMRYGFTTVKQAVAGGQYEYEKGIYFGGKQLEESLTILKNWVETNLKNIKELSVIEVHTGLGESGKDVLFWPLSSKDPRTKELEAKLAEKLSSDAPDEGVGFRTPGDLQNGVPLLLPKTQTSWILQEFGTFGPVKMLIALRDENSYEHYGQGLVNHWSKKKLLEVFSPEDQTWQNQVVTRGVDFFNKMRKAQFS